MKYIATVSILISLLYVANIYASGEGQTDWWVLKGHWDKCTTKEHNLDLEYMSRVREYDYLVPHKIPISKVAVLPPPASNKFTLASLSYFEKEALFNAKEMQTEYKIPAKKWTADKSFTESYKILKNNNLYDKYQSWVEEFMAYRTIDKELFSKMAAALSVDAFLLTIIGYDRPGAASAHLKSEGYYQLNMGLLNVFLFDAKENKLIWEYGCELEDLEDYVMTRWKGVYRAIYKIMPVE
ncbi:MAG: hypothetical protein NTY47_01440 [Candidatus Omnitrophica bacterium]|nr:hypothetical protein [Candidatus Omnitrophota bacterium]